jgi:hypothetical protein
MKPPKPRFWHWAYVERIEVGRNGAMVRVVIRKWHPCYWLAMLAGYIRKYTSG